MPKLKSAHQITESIILSLCYGTFSPPCEPWEFQIDSEIVKKPWPVNFSLFAGKDLLSWYEALGLFPKFYSAGANERSSQIAFIVTLFPEEIARPDRMDRRQIVCRKLISARILEYLVKSLQRL